MKASKAYTDEGQQQHRDYWEEASQIQVSDLVLLDETGFNRAMVTLYARALGGQRAYGPKPAKGQNISVIGALTLSAGFIAGFSFEGGTNRDTFLWYVEHVLVPNLWPGAVVVMDNLSAHKVDGVVEAIERAGARVLYLSPYSPDFNPIEHVWSKVKQHVRAVESSTKETLNKAIQSGLELICLEDVRNWFCHCCYCSE